MKKQKTELEISQSPSLPLKKFPLNQEILNENQIHQENNYNYNRQSLNFPPQQLNTIKSIDNPILFQTKQTDIKGTKFIFDKNISVVKFKQENVIGQGSYAVVKLVYDKRNNEKYAMKVYDKYKLNEKAKLNNVKREIDILRKIEHQNIVKFFYAFDDIRQIYIVTEYVGKISLNKFLLSKNDRKVQEKEAKSLFQQIIQAINYLHLIQVAHRDLKMENIMIMNNSLVKLIDFGFSIVNPLDKKLKVFCGTPSYMAPEIIKRIPYSGIQTDIWALGVILFLINFGEFPFQAKSELELFEKIRKVEFGVPMRCSVDLEEIFNWVFKSDSSQRYTSAQILQSKWLRNK